MNTTTDLSYEALQKRVVTLEEKISSQSHMMEMTSAYLNEVNRELIETKNEVQNANNKLINSIQYAQRMQMAMLFSQQEITALFPKSFVLNFPKDIVSGDFYWFCELENYKFVAAVDCTGHGVPGALLTVLANAFLEQTVKQEKLTDPAEILKALDEKIHHYFNQHQQVTDREIKDGLDIILCRFTKHKPQLVYASAHRPLFLLRGNKLHTVRGTAYSIGENSFRKEKVKNEYLDLVPSDILFLTSDGYADQFGGVSNEKFRQKKFKQLLRSFSGVPFFQQPDILTNTFKEWKQDYPQTDDVLVIGIQYEP